MNQQAVLIIGSGGREHALAIKFLQSPQVAKVFVLPGNAGMEHTPGIQCVPLNWRDTSQLIAFIREQNIALVFVGPEQPLVEGIIDQLLAAQIPCLGPDAQSAQLEGSKIFAKDFMAEFEIPTARSRVYDNYPQAITGLADWNFQQGIVIKADTLAAGKGVVVTHDPAEAQKSIYDFLLNPHHPVKTQRLLIEEKLAGKELSVFGLFSGAQFVLLGHACDYKRLLDGDQGPNTGGMGCYYTPQWPDPHLWSAIHDQVFVKVAKGIEERHLNFRGILFAGLMIGQNQIKVLEFNVRFGDPETQTLLPLLEGIDLYQYLQAAANNSLASLPPIPRPQQSSVHVVLASGGYPELGVAPLDLGHPITINHLDGPITSPTYTYYSGVQTDPHRPPGALINSGGRVLGVTSIGATLAQAREQAYQQVKNIHFTQAQYRTDIGEREVGTGED